MPLFYRDIRNTSQEFNKKSINSLCGMIVLFLIFNKPFYIVHLLKNESFSFTANISTCFFKHWVL